MKIKNFLFVITLLILVFCSTHVRASNLSKEIVGWYNDGWNAESHTSYMAHDHIFSEVNPYWYDLGSNTDPNLADGTISERTYAYSPQNVIDVHSRGDLVIPAIADHSSGQINTIIVDPIAKQNLINNIVNVVQNRNYDGFDLNFESGLASEKTIFTSFVTDLANVLHANGKRLVVTIKPVINVTQENLQIFDCLNLSNSPVDRLKIMTYDYFGQGINKPGPIAPISWVRDVLNYNIVIRGVNPAKVQLALHNYAWTWKKISSTKWELQYPHDTFVGVQTRCPNAMWQWNSTALESWKQCTYAGSVYKSYVGTADTVMARVALVDEFNLAGVAFWVLGREDTMIYDQLCSHYGTSCSTPPPSPVLLSQGKPTSASSQFDGYYTPAKATDGVLLEGWLANPDQATAWLQVDLQSVYNLSQVKIYWGGYDWSQTYDVQVSFDGILWSTVYHEGSNLDGGLDTINLTGISGQYVRLICLGPKSDNWSYEVYEIQLYGN